MSDEYEIQIIEQPGGRCIYRLVVAKAADPSALESNGKSYLTRDDAERAGRLALTAKRLRSR
jgi:hypothetical protein